MCNLDIIADGYGPNHNYTQEEIFHNWFFSSMNDPAYGILFLIFGAVFLMLVSVLVLFIVMFLKNRKQNPKPETPSVDADGSVHIIPLLCSIMASSMLIVTMVMVLGFVFLLLVDVVRLNLSGLPYDVIFLYVIIMSVLFFFVQCFSPRASKLFRTWNRIGLRISLAALVFCLLLFGFYWSIYLLAQIL